MGTHLCEESRLSLREFDGCRAPCVVIGDVIDPSADRIAPHQSAGQRRCEATLTPILLTMRSATVVAFATADSRASSHSEHRVGVENRFHIDMEGFQIAAHLGQAAYRLDGTV